jgi:outer membrane protein
VSAPACGFHGAPLRGIPCLVLLAGCAASGAVAWTEPAPAPLPGAPSMRKARITVQEAVLEALDANRSVLAARESARIADALRREARAAMVPGVRAVGTHSRQDEAPRVDAPELGLDFTIGPRNVTSLDLEASFPIFASGRYLNAWRAARAGRDRAEADREAAESDVAAAVTAAAFDLLETTHWIEAAGSHEAALARQVEDARALLAAEKVTRDAVLEAEVEHARAQRQREKLESLVPLRRTALNILLGRPTDAPTEVEDAPATAAPSLEPRAFEEEALARRPELRAADHELRRAAGALRAAIGAELPELRGVASWHADDSDFASPDNFATFALRLEVPLFRGGAGAARIDRARREVELARLRRADVEAQVRREILAAVRDVEQAYRDIGVAEQSMAKAEESLRIVREKFAVGRATSREVLDSTALLNSTRFDRIRAVYSYNVALRNLHRARGLDPRDAPSP